MGAWVTPSISRTAWLIIVCFAVSLINIAHAGPKKTATESSSSHQLRIVQVFVDTANGQILIQGEHFDNGGDPAVTLGNEVLNVDLFSSDATNILADLPPGVLDGDYLLAVSTGPGTTKFDEYDLTIGGGPGSVSIVSRSNSAVTGPMIGGQSVVVEAECNAGERAISGGGRSLSGDFLSLTDSYPGSPTPSSWIARYTNISGTSTPSGTVEAYVLCAQ